MPDATKRLDLQFGSFAVSVQGFDDPVQPVQQVLQALQNLLQETPELADAGISFDAEAIERLIGEVARRADLDEDKIEIVPGLIIVHRGSDDIEAYTGGAGSRGSDPIADAEPEPNQEPEAEDNAEPEFINIFAPGYHAVGEPGAEIDTEGADDNVLALSMASDSGAKPVDEAEPGASGKAFADVASEAPGEDHEDGEPGEDEPEVEQADEGYTAAGLAKAAGAETVAEFMISAAAWMVLLQGQTTFSRHEVIDVFETIPGKHGKSLEVRIKGFGKAVRDGHLVAIDDDRYGLSETELELFQSLL